MFSKGTLAPPCKVHRQGHLPSQAIEAHPHKHQDLWEAWRTFCLSSPCWSVVWTAKKKRETWTARILNTEQSHRPQLSYQSTTYYQLLFWYNILTHYGLTPHRKDTGIKDIFKIGWCIFKPLTLQHINCAKHLLNIKNDCSSRITDANQENSRGEDLLL